VNSYDLGLKVFKHFWSFSRAYYGSSFPYSFEDFLTRMEPKKSKLDIYINGVGDAVKAGDLSDSRIESAMRAMALASNGNIPAKPLQVVNFLSNESTKIDWVDAASYVFTESGSDLLKGAESVGKQLIFTGKILNFLLPVIIIGGLFYYLKSGGAISKIAKSIKK
jgi:hypothetical protein